MNNQSQIRTEILVSIITLGFIIALFFKYVQGAYLHMDFPFNTFLFAPDDRFRDFFWAICASSEFGSVYK